MRFGRDLHKHQIPEWASSYVRYAELKKLAKFVAKATTEKSEAADLVEKLQIALRSNVAAVETFYAGKYAILEQKAGMLCSRYGKGASSLSLISLVINQLGPQEVDGVICDGYSRGASFMSLAVNQLGPQEADEALATCLELRLGAKKLQWYGKVNKDGFSNILGKLKRLPIPNVDDCMLYQCEFAGQRRSIEILDRIDKAIVCLDTDLSTRSKGAFLFWSSTQNSSSNGEGLFFHRVIIRMGQIWSRHLQGSELTVSDDAKDSLALFTALLDRLLPHEHQALLNKDVFGRSPLHYASQYGLVEACHIILQRIPVSKAPDGIAFVHTILSVDSEGYTPLHLAVTNGHTAVVRTLLESLNIEDFAIEAKIKMNVCTTLARLADIALRANFTEIAKLILANRNFNVNCQAENGETALFVAARSGREEYVKILIESPGLPEPDLNFRENSYGWTPLIVACVQGNQSVVEILLDAGADQSLCDAFGWTARDHTAFRGFWRIGKLLSIAPPENSARIPKIQLPKTNALPPCNESETRIFVNIGTLNTREPKPVLDMDLYLAKLPYNPYPETGFSLKISAIGATGPTSLIHLPILNDVTNYPYVFTTTNLDRVKLVFSVFKSTVEMQDGEHIGGAIALLAELKIGLGPDRESLVRNYTIPILSRGSLEPIGTITFDFLVVKPFPNPNIYSVTHRGIWNEAARTQVIGHRGLGQNHPSFGRLQIGENTIQVNDPNEIVVRNLADDVQMTRDHVPIIYHDFLLSESGADLAPHHFSFDQFMHMSDIQTAHSTPQVLTENINLSNLPVKLTGTPRSRPRAHSLDQTTNLRSRSLLERMKHTYEFKLKGFKGNIRGEHIHTPFTTLEEMLRTLPDRLGIDIELKYPMLWEAEDWKMDLCGLELNKFVDIILEKVYTLGRCRNIIFTSFSPELCILLAHKQNQYPVLFLNESNLFPTGDVRASNLQEAVYFARQWNLLGVVMSSEPFVMSPKLMAYVKDAGLVSISFGFLNNDVENAKIQFDKLDAIITDNVGLIAYTLRNTGETS